MFAWWDGTYPSLLLLSCVQSLYVTVHLHLLQQEKMIEHRCACFYIAVQYAQDETCDYQLVTQYVKVNLIPVIVFENQVMKRVFKMFSIVYCIVLVSFPGPPHTWTKNPYCKRRKAGQDLETRLALYNAFCFHAVQTSLVLRLPPRLLSPAVKDGWGAGNKAGADRNRHVYDSKVHWHSFINIYAIS